MKKWELAVDYRKLRPSNLNTPEFSHLLMLLFWPLYGIVFFTLEQLLDLEYHVMYSFIDDFIPFCEFFVIPYYFWFVFMIGMLVYSFLFNIDTFRKYMKFIIISNFELTTLIKCIFLNFNGFDLAQSFGQIEFCHSTEIIFTNMNGSQGITI